MSLTPPILGGDNHLAVELLAYEPRIRCDGHHIRIDTASCTYIKYAMPASDDQKRFGDPRWDPGVQVRLPVSMVGGTCHPYIGLFYLQCHPINFMFRTIRDSD